MGTPAHRAEPTGAGLVTVDLVAPLPHGGVTGGHRYNAQLIDAARSFGFEIRSIGRRVARRAPGDVVVIDSLSAWRSVRWCRRTDRPPTVALVHQHPGGADGGRVRRSARRALDLAAYRSCDLVVVTGAAVADDLERHGVDPERIVLAPPGCDLPTPAERPPLRGGRRLGVLNVSNWLPNKGITDLLDAVAHLPEVRVHLVGRTDLDSRYESEVRRRLAHRELANRVVVHGAVGSAEVAGFLAAADVFVFPSHNESYGTVVAEALALGVPVIGWRLPHLCALIDDGVDGLLVPPGDIDGLTDAIRRVAADASLRASLAAAAYRRAGALPTWCGTATSFFGALTRLIADPVEPTQRRSTVGDVDSGDAAVVDEHPTAE